MYSYQDVYNENGQSDPTQGGPAPAFIPDPSMLHPFSGPSGIPDPANPGYDTSGYRIGSTYDASTGQVTIPNTATGLVSTSYVNPKTSQGMANPNPNANAFGVSTAPYTAPAPAPAPAPAAPDISSGALAPFPTPPPAFPTFAPFTPTTFTAPTIEDALNNPGYKFRVQQGEDALQNWAAARGTLNDSGTAKALIDYGQSAGQQGYGDVYARDFGSWQANEAALERAYGLNRQTQSIDPWTAAYNIWDTLGRNYLQNQGTVANTSLGFAQIQ